MNTGKRNGSLKPSSAADLQIPAAVCTVVSKNYLASARTLAECLSRFHPDIPLFVLLVDEVDGGFSPDEEPFTLVLARDLPGIGDPNPFFFQYNVLELNTAVKPFFFAHLAEAFGVQKLIYFDPDIYLFATLEEIWSALETHAAVVTPHITRPIEDAYLPNEVDFLRVGTFNLGFLGMDLRRTEILRDFLPWWQSRLRDRCLVDLERGYFTDQKWVDLAPCLFAGFHVLRASKFNVAYWNLADRVRSLVVESASKGLTPTATVAGEALVFFHFSGFDPGTPDVVSRHQTRFDSVRQIEVTRGLFNFYAERLLANGYEATRALPYAYATFRNGVPIPAEARVMYRELGDFKAIFGNPFDTERTNAFYSWLRRPSTLETLWQAIHRGRPELRQAFPDPFGADRAGFLSWIATRGVSDMGIDEAFLPREAREIREGKKGSTATIAPPAVPRLDAMGGEAKRFLLNRLRNNPRIIQGLVAIKRHVFRLPPSVPAPVASLPIATTASAQNNGAGRGHNGSGGSQNLALPFGVNFLGYLKGEWGVAEASRALVRGLQAVNVLYALNNISEPEGGRENDESLSGFVRENPYRVNMIIVNADMVPVTWQRAGDAYFAGRYNIGNWYWELSDFPERFWSAFEYLDEVWVTSAFCAEAISRVSSIPVVKIPYPLWLDRDSIRPDRARFGIPEGGRTFFFAFDYQSIMERKNPIGLLKAFRLAFGTSRDALLVMKSMNAERNPEKAALVRRAAEGLNVLFIDDVLGRSDVLNLIASCDCLVSLHRSEGLGLSIAEAMSMEKPVISTAYSGSMEFTQVGNSFLVPYTLTELEEDFGPYQKGNVWAEPDIERAAEHLRFVCDNPERAAEVGRRAAQDMQELYNPEAAGRVLRARLERVITAC